MTGPARPRVHIVTELKFVSRGADWEAVDLARALSPVADVTLWSTHSWPAEFDRCVPIRRLRAARDAAAAPRDGHLVVVGTHFSCADWVSELRADRLTLVATTYDRSGIAARLEELAAAPLPRAALVFHSARQREDCGRPGVLQPSLVDLDRFRPAVRAPRGPFVVGRLSGDRPHKHAEDDATTYANLAARGIRVRILGGASLAAGLGRLPGMTLLPESSMPTLAFLHGLDVFYYRTAPEYSETFGRSLAEALACGLPVVTTADHGLLEWLEPDEGVVVVRNRCQAERTLLELFQDPSQRQRLGAAARGAALRLFGPATVASLRQFYLSRN